MAGSALARLIENGGVTLYPLLLCSIVSVAVAIERGWAIARAARTRAHVHPLVLRAATQGNVGDPVLVGGPTFRHGGIVRFRLDPLAAVVRAGPFSP